MAILLHNILEIIKFAKEERSKKQSMADVRKLAPFIIMYEAGVSRAGLTAEVLFEKARKTGFANDPDDRGGATMIGVTIGAYTEYCRRKGKSRPTVAQLKAMSYAEWLDILKTQYWDRWKADEIRSQSVAEILVDWVWASGKYGITIPQRMLGVAADGVVGPKTIEAVNRQVPAQFFARLMAERKAYIYRICARRPANNKFKRGWLNRLNGIRYKEL